LLKDGGAGLASVDLEKRGEDGKAEVKIFQQLSPEFIADFLAKLRIGKPVGRCSPVLHG
jgi:hypothetical protein